MSKKIFFPNLDGLRTLAFLAVFFIHNFYTERQDILDSDIYKYVKAFFSNGMLGVNLFFVLSGFLITYLLLNEESLLGKINISNFYIRRFLRIWPLYFACVFYGFVMEPQIMTLFGKEANETADPLLFFTFLANFNNIWNGGAEAQNLPILWSVAIEEQFYVFWPILLILFRKNRYIIFITLIITSIVFRYFQADNYLVITYHTLSVVADLALGGMIAMLSFHSKKFLTFFERLKKWQISVIYIIGLSLIIFKYDLPNTDVIIAFKRFTLSCFFAFIILEQNYASNSLFKMSSSKLLSSAGKYTYGLYCLHPIAITTAKEICTILNINDTLTGVLLWQTLLGLTLSMLMAYLSYECFEKYFLKLKEKFAFIIR